MKTFRKMIYRDIALTVGFVTLAFLALFFFFDLVDEFRWIGTGTYELKDALLSVALNIPSHVYELLPITVLIGTIFVMARMAQTSEFTILRTSGLSPARALRSLLWIGAIFGVLTFLVGDYVAPRTEKFAQNYKARF